MDATSKNRSVWEGRRSALVIAHPGHELLLHGWLENAKPIVFVLTTGPESIENTGIATSAKIVRQAGGRIGSLFGRFSDRGVQQALLYREMDRFNAIVQELADALVNESINIVVGDSAEGFDPVHDLCRILVDAAVSMASVARPSIRNFEFPLFGGLLSRATTLRQRVDGEAWVRKHAHCRAFEQPIEEVQRLLATEGMEALQEECIRLATPWAIRNRRDILYSRPGQSRFPAIHFADHVQPVVGSIQQYATTPAAWAA